MKYEEFKKKKYILNNFYCDIILLYIYYKFWYFLY